MVKADPKCDYYADLELPPSADTAEIKKQFKKLALKYHPDRNPGKELEFNAKFQAIQAAHEVLTDPQQRAKYDADRIRSGKLHTYTSPVRPQPPPRAAASNFPPPPRRTPQASTTTNFPPPPSSGANRYTNHMRPDPANASKSYAEEAQARANAFKAWEHMRHAQGVPKARPVPPRPTKTAGLQSRREAGSYPPKDSTQRPPWDQEKEPVSGYPKMARSNTTREPKKGGFAPGFSAGDEPPARNTSAYFNLSKGGRPDISRPNADSRPVPPPPPPPPPFNERSTPKRPDPLKAYRTQCGPEDPFGNKDRISTPYATSGGEKTYFTSAGLGRGGTSRDSLTSEDVYDSEPLERNNSHTKHASQTSQRGHRSASPKLRSPRPVSVSSTSSSSSDESLREGVEQLYTSTDRSHSAHGRNQNRHLRPAYQPFLKVDVAEGGNGLPPGSRSDTTPKQRPHTTGSNIDPSMTEGFMEHRMKHEAERTQVSGDPVRSPPRTNDPTQSQQRPLHRPKSWHEKYGPANESDAKDYIGRPATGEVPAKPSMYDDSGCDPTFFSPCSKEWCKQWPFGGSRLSATSARPRVPPPYWAIPSCISPSRRKETARDHRDLDSNFQALRTEPVAEDADNVVLNSFTIPNETNGQPAHPPPLRSHSSDTIDVNFSPSDWHGKFTGKPEEHFEPPPRHTNVSRGRASPTKRPFSPLKQAYPAPSTERSPIPNGDSHVPPVPPQPSHQETYSADKWAPYFKPGTLNWPPPPPPTGNAVQGASRKRPITPSRRGSRNVFKRPAVPKPASVAPAVDDAGDDSASSNVGSVSGQSSGNSSAMDLDTSTTPPGGKAAESEQHANSVTPRPPVPPRPTGPSHPHIQDDDQLSLGNLKNVAPFAPNQDGIIDLNDLATALPFDSKPSTKLPRTSSPIPPQQLSLPNPPKAPPVPDKLTQSSWNSYIAAMRAYMFEWNAYNTKMLNHFNERQTSAIEMMKKPEWIGAVGEGTGNWGYKKYMRGVEEDFRVREHWDVSWERHRECMARLGEVRDRVLGREGAV